MRQEKWQKHLSFSAVFLANMKKRILSVTQLATYDMFPGGEIGFFEKIRFLGVRPAVSRSDLPTFGMGGKLGYP